MSDGETDGDATQSAGTFTVVFRAHSSARFPRDTGCEAYLRPYGAKEPVRFHILTRWVDEGHESPVPRELWIEALGQARSLDDAVSSFGPVAMLLAQVVGFCANVYVGLPEVHLAYESSEGNADRDFLEVHIPDEHGLPRQGRTVVDAEVTSVIDSLMASSEAARLSRAIQQYNMALRYWYFGGEWLVLSHLYIAVEVLTRPMIRAECSRLSITEEELAKRNKIDPEDPARPRWRPALESWARESLIFAGDTSSYKKAREGSDGLEHGFLEMDEVNKRALQVADRTFQYVRTAILQLLGPTLSDDSKLTDREPLDVQSLRKMFRGRLLSDDGRRPARPDLEYPVLEWSSSIGSLRQDGDELKVTFNERLTVRTNDGVSFQGTALEVRGRQDKDGSAPVELSISDQVEGRGPGQPTAKELAPLCGRMISLATQVGNQRLNDMPAWIAATFKLFGQQIALFESMQLLLLDGRLVEAMRLLHPLMRIAATLGLIAKHRDGALAACLRFEFAEATKQEVRNANGLLAARLRSIEAAASTAQVDLSERFPELDASEFLSQHRESIEFLHDVADNPLLAADLHSDSPAEGVLTFSTRQHGSPLIPNAIGLGLEAVVYSTQMYAAAREMPLEGELAAELFKLKAEAEKLGEDEQE